LHFFFSHILEKENKKKGIHPLKVFFAAIGGCIGIGNIVAICTAVQIGGPGAIFWVWVGGFFGMLIQYSEVFLGLKHRVKKSIETYEGGPMYYLPIGYKWQGISIVFCILLCIYATDIYMFNVVAKSISENWNVPYILMVFILLILVFIAVSGGIRRVGEICGIIIPLFIVFYVAMVLWILYKNAAFIPSILKEIFVSAFTSKAALGGFTGSSILLTIGMGLSRGAYSGDIGVGYTSILYSAAESKNIEKVSSLAIFGVFLDTFVICTMSIFLILIEQIWFEPIDASMLVQLALSRYFPYMQIFMPLLLFLLGYTTIIAYFVVGIKSAEYIFPKYGKAIYYAYAFLLFPIFSYVPTSQAFVAISLAGGFLLLINLLGIFFLRKKVSF
jgi:alanine or glycine:cation symporter, AGCS family